MPLAIIFGICLTLLLPGGSSTSAGPANVISQDAQPQENPPSATDPQSSSPAVAQDPQKASEQATAPRPKPTAPPCPAKVPPDSTEKANCAPKKTTGATTKKTHRAPKADNPTGTEPTKTVIKNGGTTEPAVDLSPTVSEQQAKRESSETNKQLEAADANLKKIAGRELSPSQQDTVKQIKNYMEQAKAAAADEDVQRAYNLAVKANLLSAELAGH
jgi:hypothetical protein